MNRKKWHIVCMGFLIIGCLMANRSFSILPDTDKSITEQKKNQEDTIDILISQLKNEDRHVYSRAVSELYGFFRRGETEVFKMTKLREVAIPLLIQNLENAKWGEGDPEYQILVIELLGEFRDERAIPAMMKSFDWVGGNMIDSAFAKIGPAVLVPITAKISNKKEKSDGRYGALVSLGRIMTEMEKYGHMVTKEEKAMVIKTVKESLMDVEIRRGAIKIIDKMSKIYKYEENKDFIPLLESISREDTYSEEITDKKGKKIRERYPAREEAKKALEQLKAKEKEGKK